MLIELNGLQQFLAFLQPRIRVRGALEVADHAALVHDDGGGALNPDEILFEFKAMIDGPFKGYFAEKVSGPGDYYRFTAPAGQTPISMTVRLTNVASNITPRIFIKTSTNSTVASNQNAGPGEQISLTFNAQPGAIYYVLVEPESTSTFSTQPYILSVAVSPK
jgi:hypothetical protein